MGRDVAIHLPAPSVYRIASIAVGQFPARFEHDSILGLAVSNLPPSCSHSRILATVAPAELRHQRGTL